MPGAGGLQCLPRVVGLETAVDMIVSGKTMLSEAFADVKLFDLFVNDDLLSKAVAFARSAAAVRESHLACAT
jgi:3-hydroxyacyl-CoA dehydrogenase